MSLQNILNNLDKVTRQPDKSYKALCPCHTEKTPSLTIKEADNKVIAHCFGCGASGVDVVNALGLDIDELFNEKRAMNEPYKPTQQEQERALNAKFLSEVSATTRKLTDNDPVTKYLNNRGIKAIPPTIRFLPEYRQDGVFHPCMIARIDNNTLHDVQYETINEHGDTVIKTRRELQRVSYHVTHLTQDGKKADVPAVKKILPCERDSESASIKLYPHNGTLAVGEGIETMLMYTQENGIPSWALINAQLMKTWRCPKDVKQLIIVADMDSSFTGQSVAYELARRSAALIPKPEYALERVNVSLIFKKHGKHEIVIDSGDKIDYLEYIQQQ